MSSLRTKGMLAPVERPPQEIVSFLRERTLFATLFPDTLEAVASAFLPFRCLADRPILRQGDVGKHLFVLYRGGAEVRVEAEDGTEFMIACLAPGDCFGEMSLLSGDPASANVVPGPDTEVLALSRAAFDGLVAVDPTLLREFTCLVASRLRERAQDVAAERRWKSQATRFLAERKEDQSGYQAGWSKAVKKLRERLQEASTGDGPVLLLGERGTGEEAAAETIHFASSRRENPLFSVDCHLIREEKWGDSLFGPHRQEGRALRAGGLSYLDLTQGGTLLLRNIEALPPGVQSRLLKHLRVQELGEASERSNARILASTRFDLARRAEGGEMDQDLYRLLSRDTIAIPPLRDRKRDLPALMALLLDKHARGQHKAVVGFSAEAQVKLLCHDYRAGNVLELEETVERAVSLCEATTIQSQEVFLGVPEAPTNPALNLLTAAPALRAVLMSPLPALLRVLVALGFAAVAGLCFLPVPSDLQELALAVAWGVGWPLLILSVALAGRVWCAVCPLATTGDAARRLLRLERRIPAFLKRHDAFLAASGIALILWYECASGARHSPLATGVLLAALAACAAACSVLYPRRTWCRHLCPLGTFLGACSAAAAVEVRPTVQVCASACSDHLCYKGKNGSPGCPTFQHLMFQETNRHCLLCLECLKRCERLSPRLNLRLPASEIWMGALAEPQTAALTGALAGLLVPLVVLEHPGWQSARDAFQVLGTPWREGALLAVFAAAASLLPGLQSLRAAAAGGETALRAFHQAWACAIPLVVGSFLAFELLFVPGLAALWADLHLEPGAREAFLSFRPLVPLQLLAVGAGLLVALVCLQRSRGAGAPLRPAWRTASLFGMSLYAAAVLLLLWWPL